MYSFFKKFIYLFIYFWLCWVFVSVRGLTLVVVSGGHSSSRCMGLSLLWPLLLRSTGSRHAGSVVVAHGPSCSAACGIFPDQGSNPCPLHWQADSQPLHHQGSPVDVFLMYLWEWGILYPLILPSGRLLLKILLYSPFNFFLNVLLNFHVFVNFPVFLLLLISYFIPLWSEKILVWFQSFWIC